MDFFWKFSDWFLVGFEAQVLVNLLLANPDTWIELKKLEVIDFQTMHLSGNFLSDFSLEFVIWSSRKTHLLDLLIPKTVIN